MKPLTNSDIKTFLESMPLYTWREFAKPEVLRYSLCIDEIDDYCQTCKQSRPFQDLRSRGSGSGLGHSPSPLSSGESYFEFKCASCRIEKREFLIQQIVTEDTIKIQKYGELPRKILDRDPLLQHFFSKDAESYEKAVVCLANGYGIAAFSYMRRIIENNINALLDMLKEDVESADKTHSALTQLAELRKDTPMSDKIKIANLALPGYLIPSGINPLGKLYQVLSEGVHNYSDTECLERARTIQTCIKYLIDY